METVESLIGHHALFKDLEADQIRLMAGCAKNVTFPPQGFLFREGQSADDFYLIRSGSLSLEVASPKFGGIVIQTVHAGEILGWSWLFPPYRWHFDAKALEQVRATSLNGKCLREKCEKDPRLGFALMKRFAGVLMSRLQSTRLQLIDAYEAVKEK